MTYGVRHLIGVPRVVRGGKPLPYLLFDYSSWPYAARKAWDYAIQCHYGHLLDFAAALICYLVVWPRTMPYASTFDFSLGGWVSIVVAYNLCCEFTLYSFHHWMMYSKASLASALRGYKYNQENQYEGPDGWANLRREVTFTTLGWLQSSAYQCVVMWLWATGRFPHYEDFWASPAKSIAGVLLMTYWREFHFYWAHRAIHPWGWARDPKLKGTIWPALDLGHYLYKYAHSLHHKSYNPGPWAGLSMHPLEHFIYYTCTLLPLLWTAHPLHFLYAKFHADIAPIGGHDGYAAPGGDGSFHWLHHHRTECNYGVQLIDFDTLFGTAYEYSAYLKDQAARGKGGHTYGKGEEFKHGVGGDAESTAAPSLPASPQGSPGTKNAARAEAGEPVRKRK